MHTVFMYKCNKNEFCVRPERRPYALPAAKSSSLFPPLQSTRILNEVNALESGFRAGVLSGWELRDMIETLPKRLDFIEGSFQRLGYRLVHLMKAQRNL